MTVMIEAFKPDAPDTVGRINIPNKPASDGI